MKDLKANSFSDFIHAAQNDILSLYRLLRLIFLRPRLHGTGQIWGRCEIRPFSPVYTRIRPVKGVSNSSGTM